MKLWLSKNSEVPMREQLITQIIIGVASGDLPTGEKLPSRGEIARRFDIHENTVSNAYKELAEKGLIQFKQGSGFYVCEAQVESFESQNDLNSLTFEFLNNAQNLGYSTEEIHQTIKKYLQAELPKEILVIETDRELREILIEEIREATKAKTLGISFEGFQKDFENYDAFFVALSDEEEKIQSVLPNDKTCVYLKANSVPSAMQGESRPTEDSLIAIVSGWRTFLMMAKTILVAAKVDADSIIVRYREEENWQRGLDNVEMIICDLLTAKEFKNDKRVRPFPLISNTSVEQLTNLIKD